MAAICAVAIGIALALPVAAEAAPFQQAYAKASNPEAGDTMGWSAAISGDTMVVGAPFESSNATGVDGNQTDNSAGSSGAVYVYTRTGETWSQQAYLKASNTESADQFGLSVAISGNTIVVGAIGEDSNATGINGNQGDNSAAASGAAYVFTRSGGTWSQQAYLKASNTGVGDVFGQSVAISGDTLVVGANSETSIATGVNGNQNDNSAIQAGAAYVFTRAGNAWSQQAYLKASNTDASDQFGFSADISGDTIVVGAFGEDSNATGVNGNQADNSAGASGAAYVFTRSAGAWSQQAYLKASNTDPGDQFGLSVAISGDTIVAGANVEDSAATGVDGNGADNSANASGAAYVFNRSANTWSQQAYLKASNTGATDQFGPSVAISGDTVVVGARFEDSAAAGVNGNGADNSANGSGAAYVYTRSAGIWSQHAYLKASNTGGSDQFGWSAAISGDTIITGAIGEASNATGVNGNQSDNSGFATGAAYAFALDADGDGVRDSADNCPNAADPDQSDVDSDGIGDACDPVDNRPTTPDPPDEDPPVSPPATDPSPETTIVHVPKNPRPSHSRFGFRSSVSGSTFMCAVDRATPKPCTSRADMRHLKRGRHVFSVVATSPTGKTDSTPATAKFRVRRPGR
jgi:hypothetical protein